MDDRRVTPLAGIASVVLFVIGVFVIESGDTPTEDSTGADIAAYFDGALGRLAFAVILWGLGTIALVWFLDGVRTHIAPFSEQLGRLAFFFGFGAALFMLGSLLPDLAGAFASDQYERELQPAAAEAVGSLGDAFFFGTEMLLVGLFLAAGLAAITTRALPPWVGWISLALAVIALIPPVGWAVVVFGFPLWILLVSALLWMRATPPAAPVAP